MANRRMFSRDIVCSDRFLDMPSSAQALYFQYGLEADDDGFVSAPKKIIRLTNASEDDLKILIAKKFVLPFESGVVVIRDWKINNYLRKDRYSPTRFKEELEQLTLVNDHYEIQTSPLGIPDENQAVDMVDTQVRSGKDRVDKERISINGGKSSRFVPPTVEEVSEYCRERGNNVDAQCFVDFYSSKGWYIGKSKMQNRLNTSYSGIKSKLASYGTGLVSLKEKLFGVNSANTVYHVTDRTGTAYNDRKHRKAIRHSLE